eukprot:6194092-Pleurochrysis_carterae.AAC.2
METLRNSGLVSTLPTSISAVSSSCLSAYVLKHANCCNSFYCSFAPPPSALRRSPLQPRCPERLRTRTSPPLRACRVCGSCPQAGATLCYSTRGSTTWCCGCSRAPAPWGSTRRAPAADPIHTLSLSPYASGTPRSVELFKRPSLHPPRSTASEAQHARCQVLMVARVLLAGAGAEGGAAPLLDRFARAHPAGACSRA